MDDFGHFRSAASRIGAGGKDRSHSIESVTVTNQQFLNGDKNGKRVVIGGELQMPQGEGRFPAVVLVHGSGGVGAREDRWARELNGIGVAVFILDTFTGRGIVQTNFTLNDPCIERGAKLGYEAHAKDKAAKEGSSSNS